MVEDYKIVVLTLCIIDCGHFDCSCLSHLFMQAQLDRILIALFFPVCHIIVARDRFGCRAGLKIVTKAYDLMAPGKNVLLC